MSASIVHVRDALAEAKPDWCWEFSFLSRAGENQFRIVARQKDSETQRTIFLGESDLRKTPLRMIVHNIIKLLPSNARTLAVDGDQFVNLGNEYSALRNDYRDQLEMLRRKANHTGQ